MTSKDSSLTKFIKEQKALLWRRLPLLALSSLMYFLYYVFGTVMAIQQVRAQEIFAEEDAIPFSLRAAEAVSALAGFRGVGWFIGFVGAIILGVQGFSFLFKSQTVDFYESRPEKRSVRFLNITLNGFLIYAVPSILGALLSFLIAVASGCHYPALLSEILVSWVYNTLIFLATYGMSLFASLLTGTLVTALLMNLYVFGIEALLRLTILGHRAAYYATSDMDNELGIMAGLKTLPPFNFLKGIANSKIYVSGGFDGTTSIISKVVPFLGSSLINVVLAVVFLILAFILYIRRRSEDAGKAVVSPIASLIIKYSAGILFALDTGLFVFWIFDRQRNSALPAVLITIVLTVFLTSVILESIFALNIRDAFKRAFDIPVILVITLAILFIYRADAFGYNRWLPDETKVESAWLLNNNYDCDYWDDSGNYLGIREYVVKNMFLKDTSDLMTLAEKGQALLTETAAENVQYIYSNEAWNATVGWRMKDGRTITRNILIPEDVDPALMDRIIGSDEFAQGVYVLNDADVILEKARKLGTGVKLVLSTYTEHGELSGDGNLLTEFIDAYRRDVSAHYDFTMASNQNPVGNIAFYTENGPTGDYYGFFRASWPIYDSYEETIDFLTNNGLWEGGNITASEVREIRAAKYDFDSDVSTELDSRIYKDENEIMQVLDSTISTSYQSAWVRNGAVEREGNTEWTIEVYPKEGTPGNSDPGICYYRQLLKGNTLP